VNAGVKYDKPCGYHFKEYLIDVPTDQHLVTGDNSGSSKHNMSD